MKLNLIDSEGNRLIKEEDIALPEVHYLRLESVTETLKIDMSVFSSMIKTLFKKKDA